MLQKDIQGIALLDYYLGKPNKKLLLHNSYGRPEEMPVEVFFRELEDYTKLEKIAIDNCKGKVLDIGAAGGSFTLELQEKGREVTALEISPLSCRVMEERGVKQIECQDLWNYSGKGFDTILLMMNGIGLAGKINRVPDLLEHLKTMLAPEGAIIVDSSDISYLYSKNGKPEDHYFGEVNFCYEYGGEKGEWFDWVYVDEQKLLSIAENCGFKPEVLFRSKLDAFLIKLK